nr:MAG TPA: hypothetical protein [Bacteriophage sp.]
MSELKFNVGDKVISFTGLQGKIEKVFNGKDYILAYIKYEDGKEEYITECDKTQNFDSFYLIGKNVFGNKIEKEELQKELAEIEDRKKLLRKQLWRLDNVMVEDWKEKKNDRIKRDKETAETRVDDTIKRLKSLVDNLPDGNKKSTLNAAIAAYETNKD